MNKQVKLYIAGKVAKDSQFGTHYWRHGVRQRLEELSGYELELLDPTTIPAAHYTPEQIFAASCQMIRRADVVVVYLSDDISVGGSQEILIAKYLHKPVVGLAPLGGKFNGSTREYFGSVIEDYKDPFVFSTCDFVCDTIEQVAATIESALTVAPKTIHIIDQALDNRSVL